jgi:hypothetical protein
MKKERCRHERNSWIICGGAGEWCYVCGAFRGLRIVGRGESVARTSWCMPTGKKEDNPFEKLKEIK